MVFSITHFEIYGLFKPNIFKIFPSVVNNAKSNNTQKNLIGFPSKNKQDEMENKNHANKTESTARIHIYRGANIGKNIVDATKFCPKNHQTNFLRPHKKSLSGLDALLPSQTDYKC